MYSESQEEHTQHASGNNLEPRKVATVLYVYNEPSYCEKTEDDECDGYVAVQRHEACLKHWVDLCYPENITPLLICNLKVAVVQESG